MTKQDEAKRFLGDVNQQQCFWVNNGHVLKNLEELASELQTMGDDTFKHHVSKERNDFTNWVNDVVNDKKLAKDLLSSKNRESALKKVRSRVNALKKKM